MARYRFQQWTDEAGNVISSENSISILVDRDMSLIANYQAIPVHILTVNSSPTGISFSIVIGGNILSYVTPWSASLEEGTYQIEMPLNIQIGADIYNFKNWEDGTTNPVRTISLVSDMSLMATYELYIPPPPTKGNLEIHAFYEGVEVSATGSVNGLTIDHTPITLTLDPKAYTITLTYAGKTQTKTTTVLEGQTIREDVTIAPPPTPIPPYRKLIPAVGALAIGTVILGLSLKGK